MTEREQFGARLKQRREALGLTQLQLAIRLGWHPASLSRYEGGHYTHSMSFARLRQLADVLETSTDYLLGRRDDPGPLPDRLCPAEGLCLSGTPPLLTTPIPNKVEIAADGEYTTQSVPAEL
jgi:transcriptional regulator with XRE-family HTH domain